MSDHLRSAEDVAREVLTRIFRHYVDEEILGHVVVLAVHALDVEGALATAEHDAEVREAARAEALAEVEPRIAAAVEHLRDYSCCDDVARILGSET